MEGPLHKIECLNVDEKTRNVLTIPIPNLFFKGCFTLSVCDSLDSLRDWSLITGRGGGLQNGRGGTLSFTPTKKGGGAEKVLAVLKGGHKKFWGSFYAVA